MSRRHSHGRRSGRRRGPVKRVVRGLADVFGIPRGVVIAGFVLGFVCVPLLTLLVFLAAWYWVDDPERTRRHVDAAYDSLRRGAGRLRRGVRATGIDVGHTRRPGPGKAVADVAALARAP